MQSPLSPVEIHTDKFVLQKVFQHWKRQKKWVENWEIRRMLAWTAHNECNFLCPSLISPTIIDWFHSGTLLHLAGSSLYGLPLWITTFGLFIRVPSYHGNSPSSSPIQRVLSWIVTSIEDFPERWDDDRTSQTKCHYIKLRSRCLTKTPKKTPSTKTAGSALKLRTIPQLPQEILLLG